MRKRRWGETGLCVLVILSMLWVFSSNAAAEMTTSFHGFFESNFVLRDVNGIQNGFFDRSFGVQQRNTLKFDVDVEPGLEWGPVGVEKVHLTYRGSYDSIFDLEAQRYHIQDNIGASRFDYGLKDIRFENDLREAFIDFAYKGDNGRGFFRPGRQIVSWGEGLLETLLDVINPPDNSFNLFFQNPDDVKIPLWMGRINYSLPRLANLGLNFDLLWIPDIRPTQWGPLDGVAGNRTVGFQAPYVRVTPYADLKGLNVREDVPTNDKEYGGKVTAEIGQRLNVSLVYFRDVVNDDAIELGHFVGGRPTQATITHGKQHVYGGFFSYQMLAGDFEAIIRGEVSHYTAYPISRATPVLESGVLKTYELKPVTKAMLAIDKDLRIKWLSHDLTKVSLEWLHKTINEWDNALDNVWFDATGRVTGKVGDILKDRRNTREQDVFMFQVQTFWWASKLNPSLLLAYDPGKHGEGGTAMIKPAIKWYITPELYTDLRLQAFVGDKNASYGFADGIGTSEATIRLGYEW